MQQVTVAWLAYRITRSSVAVGLTLALSQLPILILSPVAGVVNDRFDRRRILIFTQLAGTIQAGLLAALYVSANLNVTMIFVLAAVGGIVSSFDSPARQSIVALLVDKGGDIRNAVALNSASVHVARLVGPALTAPLLLNEDVLECFGANALSCMAFAAVLFRLRISVGAPIRRLSIESLLEGWRYCGRHAITGQALVWIAIASFFAIPYTSLLPAAARIWSLSTPISYPALMAAAGAGAVLAALVLAQIESDKVLLRAIPASLIFAALGLLSLGFLGSQVPTVILLCLTCLLGFGLTIAVSGGNVLVQHAVPEALRGRVMGLFVMLFNGVVPIGALVWGIIADRLTASTALEIAGTATLLVVVVRTLLI
jgi:MFS family permease